MVGPGERADGAASSAASSALAVCVLCGKPFANPSSHQRHLAYCRRSQERPRRRGRSCWACSRAKTKCSFHPRCLRCRAKGLECVYDRPRVSDGPPGLFSGSQPSQDPLLPNWGEDRLLHLSETLPGDPEPGATPAQYLLPSRKAGLYPGSLHSRDLSLLDWEDGARLNLSDNLMVDLNVDSMPSQDLPRCSFEDNPLLDFSDFLYAGPNPGFSSSQGLLMPDLEDNVLLDISQIPSSNQLMGGGSMVEYGELMALTNLGQSSTLNLPHGSSSDCLTMEKFAASHVDSINRAGTLAQLRMPDPTAQQNATLVMQALRAIPEGMLRRDTFPPFIHPQLYRQALPESLAICMRIAQMFTTRTPDIGSFIWRTIQTEQIRVLTEYQKLSKQELLAAIQAHMVYIVMRIIDGSGGSVRWNREMLVICGLLCRHFVSICNEPFCQDESSHPSPTWEDWIFAESRRRTACAWFLLSCIVSANNGLHCAALEDAGGLPLPSSKVQWEASSHVGWKNELEFDGNTLWTFGDLLDVHKSCNDPSSAQLLDSWNARTDNLGRLMNIATGIMCKRD